MMDPLVQESPLPQPLWSPWGEKIQQTQVWELLQWKEMLTRGVACVVGNVRSGAPPEGAPGE